MQETAQEILQTHPHSLRKHDYIQMLCGRENINGLDIAGLIRLIATQYEIHRFYRCGSCDLSGPRLSVLMRLAWEEQNGNSNGLTPTALSSNQQVTRNTISSLLRGLEEHALIERKLDPIDRRVSRIVLTESGRTLVKETAPQDIDLLNQLAANLNPEEQAQLIGLLTRLYAALLNHHSVSVKNAPPETSAID